MIIINRRIGIFKKKEIWFADPTDSRDCAYIGFWSRKMIDIPQFNRSEFFTILLDLTQSLDQIYSNMRKEFIRKQIEKGIPPDKLDIPTGEDLIELRRALFERQRKVVDRGYREAIEWVIKKIDLPKWQRILEEKLGIAKKPSGKEPSMEHLKFTENYGGIYRHQTLFKGEDGACEIIVMFWPWEDNEHITIKMAIFSSK